MTRYTRVTIVRNSITTRPHVTNSKWSEDKEAGKQVSPMFHDGEERSALTRQRKGRKLKHKQLRLELAL
ncbi:hypothetical protein E5D57_010705 [Metarhizium anisopliae]|nr:hypothetical protein E5D57_010705 [Metarhizium anisopliae]